METAGRTPAHQITFDNRQHPEYDPNSTSNMGVTGPPTAAINSTTTSTTMTTATTENSPGYVQQARETIASIAGTVQNAMGLDTPSSTLREVAGKSKVRRPSMPSSETFGIRPGEHCDGVGPLPGNNEEEGVAILPAERVSLPSQEYEGALPREHSGGVGALPGRFNESGVALLPDERNAQAVESSTQAAAHPIKTAKQRRSSTSSTSSLEAEETPGVPKKKTSLKDKLSGGMKTAFGKVMHHEELVQEGKAQRGH